MEKSKVIRMKTVQLAAVVLVAAAAKLFYSNASADDLRWILAPTALLVELAGGEAFHFESHAGYINIDHSFLIAGACSGMNFLITAFVMLSAMIPRGATTVTLRRPARPRPVRGSRTCE